MRKLIALILTVTLAAAMPQAAYAQQIFRTPASYDFELEISYSMNLVNGGDQISQSDMGMVMAMLSDIRIYAQGTSIVDRATFLSGQMFLELEMYLGFFYIPISIWFEYDLTNPDDIVYKMIVELPPALLALAGAVNPGVAHQYIVIDYADLFEELIEGLIEDIEPEYLETIAAAAIEALSPDTFLSLLPEAEAQGDNTYRLVLTNEDLHQLVSGFFWTMTTQAMEFESLFGLHHDDAFDLEFEFLFGLHYDNAFDELMDGMDAFSFLSEDWVTYFTVDENGYTTSVDSTIRFDIEEDVKIAIELGISGTFENINRAGPIEMPVLTPENSVNIFDL